MDATTIELVLRRLGEEGADPLRRAVAFAAAGVLAARDADPATPGPLLPPGAVVERGWATVAWADPTAWLDRAATGAAPVEWWQLEIGSAPNVRLAVDPGADSVVPTAVLDTLRLATAVRSVVVATDWRRRDHPTPHWTWPLRLCTGPGWPARPRWFDGRVPSFWDNLIVPVDVTGPWAVAALALLGPDDPDAADEPVRATAVLVVGAPEDPPPLDRLARIARQHAAAVVAVVDPGPNREQWLVDVVVELSHNQPLDRALVAATGPRPAPLVVGDPATVQRSRISTILDAATSTQAVPAPDDVGRPLRGARMREIAAQGPFLSEITDATEAAGLLREEQAARRGTAERTLQAQLRFGADPVARVLPKTTYTLVVGIRAGGDGPAFPTVTPEPDDDAADGVNLTVAVSDLALRPGEQRAGMLRTLRLPTVGDTDEVTFPITSGAADTSFELRIAVLHRHRLIQTGLLRGVVDAPSPPTFTIEAVVRDDAELAVASAHDVTLVLNHNTADVPVTSVVTDDAVMSFAPSDLGGVRERVEELFNRLVADPDGFEGGYDAPEFEPLMIELARFGRDLGDALFGRQGMIVGEWRERLRAAERISVFTTRPTSAAPIELLYDRAFDDGFRAAEVRLCPDAREHLVAGACPGTCPGDEHRGLVCPFGFWGVRKTIEHKVNAPGLRGSDRAALGLTPDVERHQVRLGGVVGAASARADHNDAAAWTSATAALKGTVEQVMTWQEMAALMEARRAKGLLPDVLMLVTHVERSARDGMVLEIGDGDAWKVNRSWGPLVERSAAVNPLVMVLGCGTAGIAEEIFAPPTKLLNEGAPAVVSSVATVLGRHIVPVAVQLLTELRRAAAYGGRGALLGEAMRAARRRCLADGGAVVLALATFGDADWQVTTLDGRG
jgi:hypothetical protein